MLYIQYRVSELWSFLIKVAKYLTLYIKLLYKYNNILYMIQSLLC